MPACICGKEWKKGEIGRKQEHRQQDDDIEDTES
jgi:hypothetical protein